MNDPQTTADVVAAVAKAFTPDFTIRRLKGRQLFKPDSVHSFAVFNTVCADAYHALKVRLGHKAGRPLYRVNTLGAKLWDRKIDDDSLDAFLAASGKHGLTVEVIDENEPTTEEQPNA